MANTANMRFPLIAEGQAQPHVIANMGATLSDLVAGRTVLSASLATPPVAPVEGDAYMLPSGASGWTSADGNDPVGGDIALRLAGAWHRIVPALGWRWYVRDEGGARIFTAAGWRVGDVVTDAGATFGLRVAEAVLDLSGGATAAAGLLPTRAIICGVSSWTIATVTGAASYDVGIAGEPSKFGGSLGAPAGSSNIGVVGPFATYAPGDVLVTANGGSFTGGRVGLAVLALVPGVPV
ncbi:DUF2793 domain-containing protein [Tropicimonas sp. IMCC34043]|uniref:DUF2793 domain-containing protein n=1 Tax=Tropicimonas sp. IMCC34043 TaxID=2248760 RepID=UPI000E268873|nr:DUF2793 domain-containing protein [Tropicimonas sp. IMCC34043]